MSGALQHALASCFFVYPIYSACFRFNCVRMCNNSSAVGFSPSAAGRLSRNAALALHVTAAFSLCRDSCPPQVCNHRSANVRVSIDKHFPVLFFNVPLDVPSLRLQFRTSILANRTCGVVSSHRQKTSPPLSDSTASVFKRSMGR